MIVDAHLHVWQSDAAYPDQTGTTVSPACEIPLKLLEGYMDEYGVDRAVIVQPLYPGEDNQFIVDCAQTDPERFAVVCVVDPTLEGAAGRLEKWAGEKGCRGLRLRPLVAAEEACFGDRATFPLWEVAARANVAISVLGRQRHLGTIRALADRFTDVNIVVDHLAQPESLDLQNCQALLSLADCPNISLKISGQPYYSRDGYPYDDCRDLIRAIHDRFGSKRMIWGSDFPHVLLQSGYARTRYWLERHCQYLSADELSDVLGGNAAKLYW
jgi:predicted TIM-barrel fold metal-dependent hydrolase